MAFLKKLQIKFSVELFFMRLPCVIASFTPFEIGCNNKNPCYKLQGSLFSILSFYSFKKMVMSNSPIGVNRGNSKAFSFPTVNDL